MRTATPATVTVNVPFRITKRGGRRRMVAPDGSAMLQASEQPDNVLVKALARAFRWKRMIETGEFTTIAELADREGLGRSYVTRILRMTLLAPEIVEMILVGEQGAGITLARVLEPFPVEWTEQLNNAIISHRLLPRSPELGSV